MASGRARKEQPSRRLIAAPAFAALLAVLGCGRCGASSSGVVARFDGGQISLAEFQAESSRLPPALRVEFESPRGRREFLAAMVDKRLLAGEARRQGIADDPSLRRQVQEFEDRLIVQTLLERAEKSAPSLTEAEARAWFGQHSREFAQPERVRVRRILASWGTAGPTAGRNAARDRAERLAGRLSRGEPFEKVAADGEGPERFHAGEMGILLRGSGDPDLERVAFGLASVGAVSAPFACREGYAVVQLAERLAPHEPSYDEVVGDVANRMEPLRKRRVLDSLLGRLRSAADVRIELRKEEP